MRILSLVVFAVTVLVDPVSTVCGQGKRSSAQYRQAMRLLRSARTTRDATKRNKQIDRAQRLLEQFVADNSKHPEFAQANTELGGILYGKARVDVWQSEAAKDVQRKTEYRRQARRLLAAARGHYQIARDLFQQQWQEFPAFIDRKANPDKFAARYKAEVNYIRIQLRLPFCDYVESHTYDENDPEFKKLLEKAASAFEQLHTKYRSQIGGLYAQLWRAKCLEETGNIRKALDVYNELLQHSDPPPALRTLQDRARHFRLICLNHDQRKEYLLVIHEAEEWLETAQDRPKTSTGLGIRWELARAQERRSKQADVSPAEQRQLRQRALKNARQIARYPGRYKAAASAMIARLSTDRK